MTTTMSVFRENRGVALLTATAAVLLLLTSVVGAPGMYAYNEYVGDGGDDSTRKDATAFATIGGALAGGGSAFIGAANYAGITALAYAGGALATGGALFLAGAAVLGA